MATDYLALYGLLAAIVALPGIIFLVAMWRIGSGLDALAQAHRLVATSSARMADAQASLAAELAHHYSKLDE